MSGYWPHQFTRDGEPKQVGEEQLYDNTTVPIMAQRMTCVHCSTSYIQNKESQPTGPCPARSDDREMKRIKNVSS